MPLSHHGEQAKERSLQNRKGRLYIVSTPIGNLEDITLRALRILREVDLIAAEDTRRTRKLLTHYQIRTSVTSYHEYNKDHKSRYLVSSLKKGTNVALVSDAGTPGISDPGFSLIRLALSEGIEAVPIPGVSAAITALSISGLPTHTFTFIGFLPRRKGKRLKLLSQLNQEGRTLILYESPRRILSLLKELLSVTGDREVVLAREMTKMHEQVKRGKVSEVLEQIKGEEIRGEVTLIVSCQNN